MSTSDTFDWPITARETELQTLGNAVAQRGGALLVGASGVGKSVLLSAALRQAGDDGRTVMCVGGASWSSGPHTRGFGTLAECLEAVQLSSSDGRAGERPLIGIDDVHLLDAASSIRLHRLVAAGHLTVLATARQDAPTPAGVDKLWVERLVEHVEVMPFDRSAMDSVLRARLGGHTDTTTLERLWAATHGNALMLRELVEHALEQSTLQCVDGTWRWPGLTEAPGKRLSDVIRLGLRDLNHDEHELVHMLAVAEPLESEIVAAAGLSKAAEALHQRRIVSVERSRSRVRLRLAVPLNRAVVASRMSDLTAARLRIEVADALERMGARREEDILRIVSLRMDAGLVPHPDQLLSAAPIALRRREFALAERMCLLALEEAHSDLDTPALPGPVPGSADYGRELRRLVTRVARSPEQAGQRVRATLLLGRVLVGKSRPSEAETVLAAGLESGVPVPLTEHISAVHTRVTNLAWSLRRIEEASELLDRTITAIGAHRAGVLHGTRVMIAVTLDRLHEAVALGDRALGMDSPDVGLAQTVVPTVAFARAELGDPAGGLALLDRYQEASDSWDAESLLLANSVSARCSSLLGHLRTAAAALDAVHRYDPGHGRPALLQALLDRCRLLRMLGQPQQAVALLRGAITSETAHSYPVHSAWPLAQLAGALAESGNHTEALRTLVEVRSTRGEGTSSPITEDEIDYENALVVAYTGDHAAAASQSVLLAERAAAAGRMVRAATALLLAARLTEGEAVRYPHQSLLRTARATGGLIAVYADYTAALADGDGAALMDASRQLADMGALPLASEAAAQAARAFRASGQFGKSRKARAACQDLLRGCGTMLPPWLHTDGRQERDSASLTPREQEVAALAAAGMSNRDVADRLVVSVRTVENHLHRIYHKLGITARSELQRGLEKLIGRPQENDPLPSLRLLGAGSEHVA
ncbi:LuxR C-terminal-related transcriptional regulator [Streptomyces sp. NPDC098781]|uniref:helix-turn-helix transcriptional regulator n=1 Tax=Streptomyces sp. NPDC098781 TaxID=3366097 RepID=UPI0038102462